MYTGMYSLGMIDISNAPYTCPGGNCDWDAFPTLSVSVQCFDQREKYNFTPFFGDFGEGDSMPEYGIEPRNKTLLPYLPDDGFASPTKVFEGASFLGEGTSPVVKSLDLSVGAENFDFGPRRVINRTSLDLGHLKFQWWRVQNATRVRPFNNATVTTSSTFEAISNVLPCSQQVE
jgi:hypothetical protein